MKTSTNTHSKRTESPRRRCCSSHFNFSKSDRIGPKSKKTETKTNSSHQFISSFSPKKFRFESEKVNNMQKAMASHDCRRIGEEQQTDEADEKGGQKKE